MILLDGTEDPADLERFKTAFQVQYERGKFLGEVSALACYNIFSKGCSSCVYETTHRASQRKFAVKQMRSDNDEKIKSSIKEFQLMKKLNHRNIVKVFEMFQSPGNVNIIMELVEGKELFDAIAQKNKYDEGDAQDLFKQIMEALKYLHKNSVCHRDIKPSNILVENNVIKITDFNISKI